MFVALASDEPESARVPPIALRVIESPLATPNCTPEPELAAPRMLIPPLPEMMLSVPVLSRAGGFEVPPVLLALMITEPVPEVWIVVPERYRPLPSAPVPPANWPMPVRLMLPPSALRVRPVRFSAEVVLSNEFWAFIVILSGALVLVIDLALMMPFAVALKEPAVVPVYAIGLDSVILPPPATVEKLYWPVEEAVVLLARMLPEAALTVSAPVALTALVSWMPEVELVYVALVCVMLVVPAVKVPSVITPLPVMLSALDPMEMAPGVVMAVPTEAVPARFRLPPAGNEMVGVAPR